MWRRVLAVEKTLSLCGLACIFEKYVLVFLVGKMYIELKNFREQKFVETSVVRGNSIGCN